MTRIQFKKFLKHPVLNFPEESEFYVFHMVMALIYFYGSVIFFWIQLCLISHEPWERCCVGPGLAIDHHSCVPSQVCAISTAFYNIY